MISGKYDRIVNINDNKEFAEKIPAVFAHIELEADHLSFLVGKNMSFMQNVLTMIDEVNPDKSIPYNTVNETEYDSYVQKLGLWGKNEL
jgi:hypothetical protein